MSEGRKLATIERIEKLEPIEGADLIVKATVRGWNVVVKKEEFVEGDLCVFFEIDSFIPATDDTREIFGFLDGPNGNDTTRVNDEGERGWVLKTKRLRKVYSQGLALPIKVALGWEGSDMYTYSEIGLDLTATLGIKVFERPMNAQQRGMARGTRPHFVTKTDEERIQNMKWALEKWADLDWVATQKLDGSSMSVYWNGDNGQFGVSSRNMDLKDVPESTFWNVAKNEDLFNLVEQISLGRVVHGEKVRNVVLQGELFGGSIQGNPLNTGEPSFRAFNLIVDGEVIPRADWPVEILEISVPTFDIPFPKTLDEALEQADTVSTKLGQGKVEGIVWRCRDRAFDDNGNRLSFKVISNKYLLKNDR
jgi:RNA ligase (TIGR02306 family)